MIGVKMILLLASLPLAYWGIVSVVAIFSKMLGPHKAELW